MAVDSQVEGRGVLAELAGGLLQNRCTHACELNSLHL